MAPTNGEDDDTRVPLSNIVMVPAHAAHRDQAVLGSTFRVIGPGRDLYVLDRGVRQGRLALRLRAEANHEYLVPPEGRPDLSLYLVERFLVHGGRTYVILGLPDEVADRESPPTFVLGIAGADRLSTISDGERALLERVYARARVRQPEPDSAPMAAARFELIAPSPAGSAPLGEYVVADWRIQEHLGGGAFSAVFRATSLLDGTQAAVKLAGGARSVALTSATRAARVEGAWMMHTGSIGSVAVDTRHVLARQAKTLIDAADPVFPRVISYGSAGRIAFLALELLSGRTLARALGDQVAPRPTIATLIDVGTALDRLARGGKLAAHGDVRPENIMLTDAGVRLLDPGDFGPFVDEHGQEHHVVVTTPVYYPRLVADDRLAFSLLAWETITGRHPCTPEREDEGTPPCVGPRLVTALEQAARCGNHFQDGMLSLRRPRHVRPDLPAALESILLACLGLDLDAQDRVDHAPAPPTELARFVDALAPFAPLPLVPPRA